MANFGRKTGWSGAHILLVTYANETRRALDIGLDTTDVVGVLRTCAKEHLTRGAIKVEYKSRYHDHVMASWTLDSEWWNPLFFPFSKKEGLQR